MTCALTTSRGADNPHAGHACQHSASMIDKLIRGMPGSLLRIDSRLRANNSLAITTLCYNGRISFAGVA
jgi:hypothetical protein